MAKQYIIWTAKKLLTLLVCLVLAGVCFYTVIKTVSRLDALLWSGPGVRDTSEERRPTPQPFVSSTQPRSRMPSSAVNYDKNVDDSNHRLPDTLHSSTRPNVIFMMSDDLGYGDVHYNGGNADTPNLDAMAAGPNSIHLTRYYAGAPVCSPTRGSVLTGRNPNRYCIWTANGIQDTGPDFAVGSKYPLPTSEVTVAEILKEQGYHTAVFGKWHLGDLKQVNGGNKKWPVSHPGMNGFDTWWVTPAKTPLVQPNCGCFDKSQCPEHNHHGRAFTSCRNYYTIDSTTNELQGWPEPVAGDDSLFLYERLSEYLESVSKTNKPFFVYLAFHTVHKFYLATPQYQRLYQSRNYSLDQADYYGAISGMDEVVGKIQTLLHQYNIYNNTMLWFTSDNGPVNGTPGQTAGLRGRKHTLWEGGIRVPGIIQWPSVIQENRKSDFPVVSSDLLPTICDILGVDPPSDRPIDGISLMPFLRGETTERKKSIAWVYGRPGFPQTYYALSRGRYKVYAEYRYGSDKLIRAMLYDVFDDQAESKDISANHKQLFESMQTELDVWRKSVIESATEVVKCT